MSIQETTAIKRFEALLEEVIKLQVERKDYLDKSQDLDETSRQKFVEAVEILRKIGMGDFEISELTREVLRNKIPKTSLNRYLSELKPEQSTSESEPNSDLDQNDDNNDIELEQPQIAVTTSQTIELEDQINQDVPVKDSEQFYKEQQEDPKDTEIAFLKEKVTELEDALKKTQQFTPATALEGKRLSLDEAAVFEFLNKRDNGVDRYWYPNYGIKLFRTRILTLLESKGVTTFRRLYFEV